MLHVIPYQNIDKKSLKLQRLDGTCHLTREPSREVPLETSLSFPERRL